MILSLIPNEAKLQDQTAFIAVSPAQYYESLNSFRPRKGKVIAPSDVADNGHNFEYCDGTTAVVDISEYVPSTPCQVDHRQGAFNIINVSKSEIVGAPVFDQYYKKIGVISDVSFLPGGIITEIDVSPDAVVDWGAEKKKIENPTTKEGGFITNRNGELDGFIYYDFKSGS